MRDEGDERMLVWRLFLEVAVFIAISVSVAEGISYLVVKKRRQQRDKETGQWKKST